MIGSWMKKFRTSVLCVAERVDVGRGGVREAAHVGLVDRLEAADRGAVEVETVVEDVLAEGRHRHREVLHDAGQVAEADVDHLDVVVADEAGDLVGTGEHRSSGRGWAAEPQATSRRLPVGVPGVSEP